MGMQDLQEIHAIQKFEKYITWEHCIFREEQ
jgi:hypothetical protein